MITGIGHIAYRVTNLEESLKFYCDVLGFKEAFRLYNDQGELWIVYLKISGNNFIELFPYKGELEMGYDNRSFQHLCLLVDNIDETLKELSSRGLEIQGKPNKGKDGNYQYWITDPDGNRIELMQIMPDSLQAKS
ncbi:MAG: VOC family protein [bacterium]|nr:VOC family protein [bacterium]